MRFTKLLRQLVMLCLLMTIPVLGMAGHMPCDAAHHQHSQQMHAHHHDGNATHGHDSFGHDYNHDYNHGQASYHKCCDGAGGCCMSMMSALDSPIAMPASGSERIALSATLFTAVIPATPQRPPSLLSA